MLPPLGVAVKSTLAVRRAPAQLTGELRVGVGPAVAEVPAHDQAAHAVADEVEARAGVAHRLGQPFEPQREPACRLDEVAPPVVGVDRVAQACADARLVAGRVQELEEVVVLGEAEGARQRGVGADQEAGSELVARGSERQPAGQREVVVAERVAEVQPGDAAVRPQQLAAEQPRHEDDHRRPASARQRADDAAVEPSLAARGAPGRRRAPGPRDGGAPPVRPRAKLAPPRDLKSSRLKDCTGPGCLAARPRIASGVRRFDHTVPGEPDGKAETNESQERRRPAARSGGPRPGVQEEGGGAGGPDLAEAAAGHRRGEDALRARRDGGPANRAGRCTHPGASWSPACAARSRPASPSSRSNLYAQVRGARRRTRGVGAADNKKAAEAFRDTAAKEPGAVDPSGLVFKSDQAGHGREPEAEGRGQRQLPRHAYRREGLRQLSPARPAGRVHAQRVIPCWTEGVRRMKVGEKAKIVCPSEIAYGDRGTPTGDPTGCDAVFEVELSGSIQGPRRCPARARGEDHVKIHEYQGKAVLAQYGVPVPKGKVAYTVDEAMEAAKGLGLPRRGQGADPRRRPRQGRRHQAREDASRIREDREGHARRDASRRPRRGRRAVSCAGCSSSRAWTSPGAQGDVPRDPRRPHDRQAGVHGLLAGRHGHRGGRREEPERDPPLGDDRPRRRSPARTRPASSPSASGLPAEPWAKAVPFFAVPLPARSRVTDASLPRDQPVPDDEGG